MQPTKESHTEILRRVTSDDGYDLSNMFRAGWFGIWLDRYNEDVGAPAEYVVLTSPEDGQLDLHRITFKEASVALIRGPLYDAIYAGAQLQGSLFLSDEQVFASEFLVQLIDDIFSPVGFCVSHTSGSSFDWRRSFASCMYRYYRREVA